MLETHEVLNQPPALVGYDAFAADQALAETVERYGAGWVWERLSEIGKLIGGERVPMLTGI